MLTLFVIPSILAEKTLKK
jgi:hypothetical protein